MSVSPMLQQRISSVPNREGALNNAAENKIVAPKISDISNDKFVKKSKVNKTAIGALIASGAVIAGAVFFTFKRGKLVNDVYGKKVGLLKNIEDGFQTIFGDKKEIYESLKTLSKKVAHDEKVTMSCARETIETSVEFEKISREKATEAQKTAESLKEKVNYVTNLFQNGGQGAKEGIVKIDGDVMEEVGKNFKRKSFFNENKIVQKIEEETDGVGSLIKCTNGNIDYYREGYKAQSDTAKKMSKVLGFKNGDLLYYAQDCETLADSTKKAQNYLGFEDGKLSGSLECCELLQDNTMKSAKSLNWIDGALSYYDECYECLPDGTERLARRVEFDEKSVPYFYIEALNVSSDGSKKMARGIEFDKDGKLLYYGVNGAKALNDVNVNFEEKYEF